MTRHVTLTAAALLAWALLPGTAEAGVVKRDTLRPQDVEASVNRAINRLSGGDLNLNEIEGVHHPRTKGDAAGQDNVATIYARVTGQIGQSDVVLDRDIVTFACDQLEDDRWICSDAALQALLDSQSTVTEFFILEK